MAVKHKIIEVLYSKNSTRFDAKYVHTTFATLDDRNLNHVAQRREI